MSILEEEFPDLFSGAFDVSLPAGWTDIARATCQEIISIDPQARARQLKEKFGGGRFYVDSENPEVHRVIDHFEHASSRVCQVCGALGRPRSGGYVRTLCDEHAAK